MLPCSGDNLAVSHDSDPASEDILTVVGVHLDVHAPSIALEGGGHIHISHPVSEMVNLGFAGVYCSGELVNAAAGFGELLVECCCASVDGGDKAVCNSMCSVMEVVTILHAEDGLS